MVSLSFHHLFAKFQCKQDPAGLGIARFLFGLIMLIDTFEERGLLEIPYRFGDPDACRFPLFNDLPLLSMEYMHVLYLVLLLSAVGIMLGFLYRWSCFCFMIAYWYVFFLDKTTWNNHSYLYGLLSFLFFITDAHHYYSVDSLIWPSIRNTYVPSWNYGIFRFQLFLMYFYAGIKKIDYDWYSGYSMTGLSTHDFFYPFRLLLTNEQIDFYLVHICGLMFDLTVGFLLYFDSTRVVGLILAFKFHIMNAIIFSIGMFSYACMGMITIFCFPDWPKKIISKFPAFIQLFLPTTSMSQENKDCTSLEVKNVSEVKPGKSVKEIKHVFSMKIVLRYCMIFFYVLFQLSLPYSHSITKGYNAWTQGLYGYSWDMMVHSWNTQHVVVRAVDKTTGKEQFLRPGAFAEGSGRRYFGHPDMMKQYATCLARHIVEIEDLGIRNPEIYFDIWKSLNGRYQQRLVDPRVDLVSAQWNVMSKAPWIFPLLVDLSSRSTIKGIKSIVMNASYHNTSDATDIVFVADFPGLFLENYIAPEIKANVTVLSGAIIVEMDSTNTSVAVNETLTLKNDTTHTIYTVSDEPSTYMYIYYNTTMVNKTDEELIQSDPGLQKRKKLRDEEKKKSVFEKFFVSFLYRRFVKYRFGLGQIYFAICTIFGVELDFHTEKNKHGEL